MKEGAAAQPKEVENEARMPNGQQQEQEREVLAAPTAPGKRRIVDLNENGDEEDNEAVEEPPPPKKAALEEDVNDREREIQALLAEVGDATDVEPVALPIAGVPVAETVADTPEGTNVLEKSVGSPGPSNDDSRTILSSC